MVFTWGVSIAMLTSFAVSAARPWGPRLQRLVYDSLEDCEKGGPISKKDMHIVYGMVVIPQDKNYSCEIRRNKSVCVGQGNTIWCDECDSYDQSDDCAKCSETGCIGENLCLLSHTPHPLCYFGISDQFTYLLLNFTLDNHPYDTDHACGSADQIDFELEPKRQMEFGYDYCYKDPLHSVPEGSAIKYTMEKDYMCALSFQQFLDSPVCVGYSFGRYFPYSPTECEDGWNGGMHNITLDETSRSFTITQFSDSLCTKETPKNELNDGVYQIDYCYRVGPSLSFYFNPAGSDERCGELSIQTRFSKETVPLSKFAQFLSF